MNPKRFLPFALVLLFGPLLARGQNILVTTTRDAGPGSLREAVQNGLDAVITFDPGLSGQTILLTSGELGLNRDLTIDASSLPAGININGNHASRIFHITSDYDLELISLTLTNGWDASGTGGGAIFKNSKCNLVLSRCTFAGSQSTYCGGAIYSSGYPTHVSECTLARNSSKSGGAIFNAGSELYLSQCTIAENQATGSTSDPYFGGGGVFSVGGGAALTNSIIAGNTSTGGSGPDLRFFSGLLYVGHCLIGNPADSSIANGTNGSITGVNALLSPFGNYGGPTPTMPPLSNSPAIDLGADTADTIDQRGFPRLLGVARDIGAVEVPTPVYIVTTAADSGAGSLRQVLTQVGTSGVINFAAGLSGQTILLTGGELLLNKQFLIDASALPAGIRLNGNHASRLFEVAAGKTVVLDSLTLTNGLAPSGGAILNAGALTLNRCTLAGNAVSSGGGGGGIYNNLGILTLNQCTVAGNSATIGGAGGGIFNLSGGQPVTLNQCTVTGNSAVNGGGVASFNLGSNNVTCFNSIVAGNTASSGPDLSDTTPFLAGNNLVGGVPLLAPLGYYGGPAPTMPPLSNSPVIDAGADSATNTFAADQRGLPRRSGLHVDIGAAEFQAPVVASSADSGVGSLRAALSLADPGARITFAANLSGATIALSTGELLLNKSLSIDATALPGGVTLSGGNSSRIFNVASGPTIGLQGLTLTQGSAPGSQGGALYSAAGSTLQLARCTFTANSALEGGAILNDGVLLLDHCTFSGNNGGYGGALQCRGLTTLTHCTISGNDAAYGGGGVFDKTTTLTVRNSIIAGNTPSVEGHDLYVQLAALVRTNANLIQSMVEDRITAPTAGPAPISNDPLLAPLGNYGGPVPTMALLPGSPARDAALGSSSTSDQRGFPIVGNPDLGAYEAGGAANFNAWIWETLVPFTADHSPTADPDGDGATNYAEWVALTDPGNPGSVLRALVSASGASVLVSFVSVSNRHYTLWHAAALAGPWTDTGLPAVAGNGATRGFTYNAAGPAVQFLRIQAAP